MKRIGGAVVLALLVAGATSADESPVKAGEKQFTLGLVQQLLRVGMSQTELAAAIGSPNMVTRSGDGREAWAYDKVASETTHDGWRIGGGALGTASGASAGILAIPFGAREKSHTRTSQRTLTIVVRFTTAGVVESFSYHAAVALHVIVHGGRDWHHITEAQYKAVARALRTAVELDPREQGVPSTKGVL